MSTCNAEFLVEPFEVGHPGPHVAAALAAVRALGFEPEVGPFGTTIEGDSAQVIAAVKDLLDAATAAGASRVSVRPDKHLSQWLTSLRTSSKPLNRS